MCPYVMTIVAADCGARPHLLWCKAAQCPVALPIWAAQGCPWCIAFVTHRNVNHVYEEARICRT